MTLYLLDSNVFIEAKNRHYGFDFCPACWDWLIQKHSAGRVTSVQQVLVELARGKDELTAWAKERGESFFLPPNLEVEKSINRVVKWINDSECREDIKKLFWRALIAG